MQREREGGKKKKKPHPFLKKKKNGIKADFSQDLSYSLAADVPLEGVQPGLPAQEVNQLEVLRPTDGF